jgi:hypothetical protein
VTRAGFPMIYYAKSVFIAINASLVGFIRLAAYFVFFPAYHKWKCEK